MDDGIRKLAKENKHQLLFSLSKEGSLTLFDNKSNYTNIQISFLSYLAFYHGLYTDIAMDYVTEIVLEDPIYEDAYMYWKNKTDSSEFLEKVEKKKTIKPKKDIIKETVKTNEFNWVMKKRK